MATDRFSFSVDAARDAGWCDPTHEQGFGRPSDTPTEVGERYPSERWVHASLDEILYAERLRLQLRERYPDTPAVRVPPWCVGVD